MATWLAARPWGNRLLRDDGRIVNRLPINRDGTGVRVDLGPFDDVACGINGDGLVERNVARSAQALGNTPGHQTYRKDEREWQEHVERAADEVDPEAAQTLALGTHEAPDESKEHGHAHGGRQEVLHPETSRLGEPAERGLTRIGLPVGVGHEADRGVEGEIPTHAGEPIGGFQEANPGT